MRFCVFRSEVLKIHTPQGIALFISLSLGQQNLTYKLQSHPNQMERHSIYGTALPFPQKKKILVNLMAFQIIIPEVKRVWFDGNMGIFHTLTEVPSEIGSLLLSHHIYASGPFQVNVQVLR